MYSRAMSASSVSVNLSSGCGFSEMWITGFSVRIRAGRYLSKSAVARAISTVPVPLSRILLEASSFPSPSFTFCPLYANAPYREFPTLMFATIPARISVSMLQFHGSPLQAGGGFFPTCRAMPSPFFRKNGS